MKNNLCSILLLSSTIATMNVWFVAARSYQDGESSTIEFEDQSDPINIELAARVDYQREYQQSDPIKGNSGFKGKFLMLTLSGNITKKLSYSYRQRLNELHHDKSFFDGTDRMFLKYKFNSKWDIAGGKMPLDFGSYEYQRDPMEMYFASEFWNTIPCYKFAVSCGFNVTPNDRLTMQFSESPFRKKGEELYGYNIAWYGNHDWLKTVYSVNMLEYQPGHFIYYLGLGHKFDFGKVAFELDYMNRATGNHVFFFKDCSLTGELSMKPTEHWNIFAKACYNRNVTTDPADECVWPGTDVTQLGGGVEFFPLPEGDKSVRMHVAYNYCFGENGNVNGVLQKDQHFMSIGVLWKMDMVRLAKNIWKKCNKNN